MEVFKPRQFCSGCTAFGDAVQAGLHGNIKWNSRQCRCQSKKMEVADCFATFIRHRLKHQGAVNSCEFVHDLQILEDVCSLWEILHDDFSAIIEGADPFELQGEFDLNEWPYRDDLLQEAASPSPLSLPLPSPPRESSPLQLPSPFWEPSPLRMPSPLQEPSSLTFVHVWLLFTGTCIVYIFICSLICNQSLLTFFVCWDSTIKMIPVSAGGWVGPTFLLNNKNIAIYSHDKSPFNLICYFFHDTSSF